MTEQTMTVAAIDVGSTKVFCIVARHRDDGLEVVAHGVAPSRGVRKGSVVDVEAAQRSVREALRQAEAKLGRPLQEAYVGITGAHVAYQNRWDTVEGAGVRGVITAQDLSRIPQAVARSAQEEGRKVIHALPVSYSLDGRNGIRNPLGMHSHRLQVETHVVTASDAAVDRLRQAVERAGVRVLGLVLEPLADAEVLLSPPEMEVGVALVDVGGGTTDLVYFKHGALRYTAVIPVGGFHFTNDISVTYGTPYEAAEKVKLESASVDPDEARPDEDVFLPIPGKRTPLRVARREICQLTRERAQELVRIVAYRLRESGVRDLSDTRLVLTGGACRMPGLEALFRRAITSRVRIGSPEGALQGLPQEVSGPAFATGVGLLLWAARRGATPQADGAGEAQAAEKGGTLARLMRRLLPR